MLKVQRPGLREQVLSDLQALGQIASFLYEHTEAGQRFAVDQLFKECKSLLRELDSGRRRCICSRSRLTRGKFKKS